MRGGSRPGAGRPKKSVTSAVEKPKKRARKSKLAPVKAETIEKWVAKGQKPLEYMLSVMNDPEAEQARRDRMAQAAAPFVHPRAGDAAVGKKEQKQLAAEDAAVGKFAPSAPPKLVVDNAG